jgi:hypothetical protein
MHSMSNLNDFKDFYQILKKKLGYFFEKEKKFSDL